MNSIHWMQVALGERIKIYLKKKSGTICQIIRDNRGVYEIERALMRRGVNREKGQAVGSFLFPLIQPDQLRLRDNVPLHCTLQHSLVRVLAETQ